MFMSLQTADTLSIGSLVRGKGMGTRTTGCGGENK
jgi:hypothetical protein